MKFPRLFFSRKDFNADKDAHLSNLRTLELWADKVNRDLRFLRWGEGSPENVVVAPVGALYLRKDGGAGTTLYVKESGTSDTGWIAK